MKLATVVFLTVFATSAGLAVPLLDANASDFRPFRHRTSAIRIHPVHNALIVRRPDERAQVKPRPPISLRSLSSEQDAFQPHRIDHHSDGQDLSALELRLKTNGCQPEWWDGPAESWYGSEHVLPWCETGNRPWHAAHESPFPRPPRLPYHKPPAWLWDPPKEEPETMPPSPSPLIPARFDLTWGGCKPSWWGGSEDSWYGPTDDGQRRKAKCLADAETPYAGVSIGQQRKEKPVRHRYRPQSALWSKAWKGKKNALRKHLTVLGRDSHLQRDSLGPLDGPGVLDGTTVLKRPSTPPDKPDSASGRATTCLAVACSSQMVTPSSSISTAAASASPSTTRFHQRPERGPGPDLCVPTWWRGTDASWYGLTGAKRRPECVLLDRERRRQRAYSLLRHVGAGLGVELVPDAPGNNTGVHALPFFAAVPASTSASAIPVPLPKASIPTPSHGRPPPGSKGSEDQSRDGPVDLLPPSPANAYDKAMLQLQSHFQGCMPPWWPGSSAKWYGYPERSKELDEAEERCRHGPGEGLGVAPGWEGVRAGLWADGDGGRGPNDPSSSFRRDMEA